MIALIAVLVLLALDCGFLTWKYINAEARIDELEKARGILTDSLAGAGESIAGLINEVNELEDVVNEHLADAEALERERKELDEEKRIVDGMASIFSYDLATAMGKKKAGAE